MSKLKTLLQVIGTEPARDRTPALRGGFTGDDSPVIRRGGTRKAGLIRGASLIASGEALGHGVWIDGEALGQVVELGNAAPSGVKVRFTHPSMSGDGLGSYMGRAKSLRINDAGDRVLGDVHFSPSAHNTPDGDSAEYVMTLAEDDPDAFGMSIVFDHDHGAEEAFVDGHTSDEAGFVSPDAGNLENYPHIRLAVLHGADFVDEPAANPDGLFHRGPTASMLKQADTVVGYVLGLDDTAPNPSETGGVSAERLRGFFTRFCDARGVVFQLTKGADMTLENETTEPGGVVADDADLKTLENDPDDDGGGDDGDGDVPAEETQTEPVEPATASASASEPINRETFKQYVDEFGAAKAAQYLSAGTSFSDALSAELAEAKGKLATIETDRGEGEPATTYTDAATDKQERARRKAGYGLPISGRFNGETIVNGKASKN